MNIKKIAQFAIGPVAGALLGFISLPLITWFFAPEDVGRIAMYNIALSLSVMLFSLGLDQAYVREYHESSNKIQLLKTSLFPGLLILTTCFSVSLLFSKDWLSSLLFDLESGFLSLLVMLSIFVAFLARFFSLILRMEQRALAFSIVQVSPKVFLISLVLIAVAILASPQTQDLVLITALSQFLTFFILFYLIKDAIWQLLKQRFDFNLFKTILAYGFPLIFGSLAFWGLTAIDKVLLKKISGLEELGLYSVSVSFAAAAAILQNVFSTVWAPTVYKWVADGENLDKIQDVHRYILFIVIVLFCLAGLLSWIVPFFLPSYYVEVQWVLISCLGYPLLYTLSETTVVGINVAKRTGLAMLSAILAFVFNIALSFILIPVYGAAGAAASTCAAFFLFFLLRTELSARVWVSFPRTLLYGYTFLLVFGACTSTLFGKDYATYSYVFWFVLFVSSLIIFKKELASFLRFVVARKKREIA
ncbi:lipopolysaccharide biosynthesis protein [Pseudoalteromonas umbrosa]|uniref:lipopolysaccharide biosynthesis protein n=1 Tax=Pseudoalteromonas umbrosa TaxID=3048489 RepID=UPI0024C313AD|nr:oligosaccharide flippase family protein [Pseudoalteromonas sp. B95]MDK1289579.1 oligosaccharide flippase family protein [Pseudoalteromonas sp. B95]